MSDVDNSNAEVVEVGFSVVNEIHFECPACGADNEQETEHLHGVETDCDECGQPIELVS